jgi:hypothetical protein
MEIHYKLCCKLAIYVELDNQIIIFFLISQKLIKFGMIEFVILAPFSGKAFFQINTRPPSIALSEILGTKNLFFRIPFSQ